MKKIALIINSLEKGGAEKNAAKFANLLSKNYKVSIIKSYVGKKKLRNSYKLNNSVEVIDLKKILKKSSFANLRKILVLRKVLKIQNFDIAFSFLDRTNVLLLLSTLFNPVKKLVFERNNPFIGTHNIFLNFLRRILYFFCDFKLLVQSNSLKKDLKRLWGLNSYVLRNPIELDFTKYRKKKNIICVSTRLDNNKNHMLLLKALTYTQIQNIYKSYKFKIYGKGHLENKLKKFI